MMTSFRVHTLESAPEKSKPALQGLKQNFGMVPNLAATMAESPTLVNGFVGAFGNFHGGSFTGAEKQTLLLTNAVANRCEWAVAFHSTMALKEGVTAADVEAIRTGRAPEDASLAALVAFDRALIEKDAPALQAVRRALDAILAQQEPFPAVVMNPRWDIVQANRAASNLFAFLLQGQPPPRQPANVLRLMFHPDAVRPFVANWEAVAEALLRRVHREAVGGVKERGHPRASPRDPRVSGRSRFSRPQGPEHPVPRRADRPRRFSEGGSRVRLLLDGHHAGHSDGRHGAGDPYRVLLSRERWDRRASANGADGRGDLTISAAPLGRAGSCWTGVHRPWLLCC